MEMAEDIIRMIPYERDRTVLRSIIVILINMGFWNQIRRISREGDAETVPRRE